MIRGGRQPDGTFVLASDEDGRRRVEAAALSWLADIRCLLLDMDGTVTLGEGALPGAVDTLEAWKAMERDRVFVTNNSSHGTGHYVRRLNRAGIPTVRREVMTSTDALKSYLSALSPDTCPTLFPLGTPDFVGELADAGYPLAAVPPDAASIRPDRTGGTGRPVDFVVLGFDTTLRYEKLDLACTLIRAGVPWIATNPDRVCPLEGGRVLPDCGAMTAFLQTCTGIPPLQVVGKPDTLMIDLLRRDRGLDARALAMAGDRIETDLEVARKAGIRCIAVLSGVSTLREIVDSGVAPDLVLDGIADLLPLLRGLSAQSPKEVRP